MITQIFYQTHTKDIAFLIASFGSVFIFSLLLWIIGALIERKWVWNPYAADNCLQDLGITGVYVVITISIIFIFFLMILNVIT